MTEEGMHGHPLDSVEALAAMANMAALTRRFYDELIEQGFSEQQAFDLARAYLHGVVGGKLQ